MTFFSAKHQTQPAIEARLLVIAIRILIFSLTVGIFLPLSTFAQGPSAVITLVMPVGARQLGMGETAIATADDAFATFWNPAGLACGPLADEWEVAHPLVIKENGLVKTINFTCLTSRSRTGFLYKSTVWAGTKEGLLYYDGKTWKGYHEHVLEQGEEIRSIVRKFSGSEDNLDERVARVKKMNQVTNVDEEADLITLKLPYNLIFPNEMVTALRIDNLERLWVGTDSGLYRFSNNSWKSFAREEGFGRFAETQTLISSPTPTPSPSSPARSDSLTSSDTSTSVDSSATADSTWSQTLKEDTVKATAVSRGVTCITMKGPSVWIGTTDGLFEYRKNALNRRGQNLLKSQWINAIAANEAYPEIYVATKGTGIARYTPPKSSTGSAKWKLFTSDDGLLDNDIRSLALDNYSHLWSAHNEGVTHFSLQAWEKIYFRKQEVRSIALGDKNVIWIGTNQGAWRHFPPYASPSGKKDLAANSKSDSGLSKKGSWTHFHNGNGLNDKNVKGIETQDGDVWFITDGGLERYHASKTQVGFFFESLLPLLNVPDLYHAFLATTFPLEEWGTVGGFINYVSFGENNFTSDEIDNANESGKKFSSYELVAALSYGTRLTRSSSLGLNVKFIYSALAPSINGSNDAIAASYAVDVGFLWKDVLLKGLDLALVAQNMGPAVFYIDQNQADPIPFTWKVGLAYELLRTPNHRLTVAADANREAFGYEEEEGKAFGKPLPFYKAAWSRLVYACEDTDANCNNFYKNLYYGVYNSGLEYTFANVVALRSGFLYDKFGQRFEMDIGLGFMLSDILQIDGTYIKSFRGGVRDGQKRFSMVMKF